MTDLREKINQEGLIFDGAMGTMLMEKGLEQGKPPEIFNLENPEAVKSVHESYISAGAEVITTNTFGGTALKLSKTELKGKQEEVNKVAVEIAREAAGGKVFVAGDIGPTGEMLKPFGLLDFEKAVDIFAEQASYLDEAGVDLFIIETMFDINEMLAAIKGVRTVSDKLLLATMTFEKKPTGFFTIMGNSVPDCMEKALDEGADAVGANCSIGSDTMIELARLIRKSVTSPVIIQPNAGVPEVKDGNIFYPESADFFCDNIVKIKSLGVEIVGGCCGTNPVYTRCIAERIRGRS